MTAKPLVTITSEYGLNSPYQAAIKGTLLKGDPTLNLIDISHAVLPNDIMAAAYLVRTSSSSFPARTIHLICVDLNLARYQRVLVAKHNDQFFVAADNGIFSLLFKDLAVETWIVNPDMTRIEGTFPEKDIFAAVAFYLTTGNPLSHIATPGKAGTIRETLTPVVEGNVIRGSIIFVDGYQNIITDITKSLFESMQAKWKNFEILYRRKSGLKIISRSYDDEKNGEILALFNSQDFLEIALRHGQAESLLGLKVGGNIIIEFHD